MTRLDTKIVHTFSGAINISRQAKIDLQRSIRNNSILFAFVLVNLSVTMLEGYIERRPHVPRNQRGSWTETVGVRARGRGRREVYVTKAEYKPAYDDRGDPSATVSVPSRAVCSAPT